MSGEEENEDGDVNPEETKEKLNPKLLNACMRNDTEEATQLIMALADPWYEDSRQWSPMIWAANHGNDSLTRLLISRNAADVYKYDESQGKAIKKKHSPLHWAAFKGHLQVLWLLMAPPQNLSHHERDAIGNTPLHQAAAGGSLECCKCLMAQGVDVFAKNNRGHTPFALCTVPEVQELLKKAMECKACKATGRQFSATVMRYLCSWSLDVFCETAVTQLFIYETPFSTEKERPVTWCTEVKDMVNEVERQLEHAMHLNQLETVIEALCKAEDKPIDCQLVYRCNQVKAKLESEIQLGKAAQQVQKVTNLDEFGDVHAELSAAIEDAEAKNADPARVLAAKTLRRRLLAEASLLRAVEGPQKTTPGHITMLQELNTAARAESASEDLLVVADKLIAKLMSERDVQKRVAETAPLAKLTSFKDAETAEGLPEWSLDTEQFEDFHEAYKSDVEQAERNDISKDLMAVALEQLLTIEYLLQEKKQIEEEKKLKAGKKGGKKK